MDRGEKDNRMSFGKGNGILCETGIALSQILVGWGEGGCRQSVDRRGASRRQDTIEVGNGKYQNFTEKLPGHDKDHD